MKNSKSVIKFLFWLIVSIASGTALSVTAVFIYLTPQLPDIQSLKNIELQIPLRIYSSDGQLISEFGEQRRRPIMIDDVPAQFVNALIAAEDDSFLFAQRRGSQRPDTSSNPADQNGQEEIRRINNHNAGSQELLPYQ